MAVFILIRFYQVYHFYVCCDNEFTIFVNNTDFCK